MKRQHLASYLSGVLVAEFPDTAPGAGELEELLLAAFAELDAASASMFVLGRDDDELIHDEYTHAVVDGLDDWDIAESDSDGHDEAVGYWIRRYVAIDEVARCYVDGKVVT
ncbi:MAG: hypothetical protein HKN44_13385 [Ilumatobacter sp.]|nr:hypothetical protein [Ilumatobacter sp.]